MISRLLVVVISLGLLLGGNAARADDKKLAGKDTAKIAGVWDSGWGTITLKTSLSKDRKILAVTGSYESNTGENRKGLIKSGTYDPATGILEVSLEEPWWGNQTTGTARLTRAADGAKFEGPYVKTNKDGARDEGVLSMTRSIAGSWDSPWGTIILQTAPIDGQTIVSVDGYYPRRYDQTGLIKSGSFDPATGQLNFAVEEPWWDNDTKGNATLTLAADGTKFEGGYVITNNAGARDAGLLSMTRGRSAAFKPVDLTGIWDSPWGIVTLRSKSIAGKRLRSISGSYDSITGKNRTGIIKSGTFDPATGILKFALDEPWWGNQTKGTARLSLNDTGTRLQGLYAKTNQDGVKDDGVVGMVHLGGDNFPAALDSFLADAGINADTPGAAVMVIEHGKVAFTKCAGLSRLTDKKPITPQTTFELCSISKQFTGAAILRLSERGLLDINDDIRRFIPEMPIYDANNPIRILNLARHTSGIPDIMYAENVQSKNPNYLTNEDFAGEFARQLDKFPLKYPTGQSYEYSNTGYMVLGLVVERVSKQSYSNFMKNEFFDPLGMKTACVSDTPSDAPPDPAYSYTRVNNDFQFGCGPASVMHARLLPVGHSGVCASLDDMARWDAGWREGRILKPATQKQAFVYSKFGNDQLNVYAFGWGFTIEQGRLLDMAHNGSFAGFLTYIHRDVEHDRTLIVLANVDSLDVGAIVRVYRALPR